MTNLDQQIAATISTISHEQAAKLLRISPEQLTKLVDAEIILSAGSGIYSASTIVLNYIEYLRDQIEQSNKKIAQPRVTLEVAADYLGISYRNMRGLLSAWGISLKTTPLDQIRVRYIRELRHAAGEDDPSNPEKLIAERMATAREQGEL